MDKTSMDSELVNVNCVDEEMGIEEDILSKKYIVDKNEVSSIDIKVNNENNNFRKYSSEVPNGLLTKKMEEKSNIECIQRNVLQNESTNFNDKHAEIQNEEKVCQLDFQNNLFDLAITNNGESGSTQDDMKEYSHLDDIFNKQFNSISHLNKTNSDDTINRVTNDIATTKNKTIETNYEIIDGDDRTIDGDVEKQAESDKNREINEEGNSDDDDITAVDDRESDKKSSSSEDDDGIDYMELAMEMIRQEPIVRLERVELLGCPFCRAGFLRARELRAHCLRHIEQQLTKPPKFKPKPMPANKKYKPTHKCPDCDAMFVLESTLETHSIIHQPFPYICNCEIGYYKMEDLLGHVKIVHNNNIKNWIKDDLVMEKENESSIKKDNKDSSKRKDKKESSKEKKKRSDEPKVIYKDEDGIKLEVDSDTESVISNWATGKKRSSKRHNKKKSKMDNFLKLLVPEINVTESQDLMCPICHFTVKKQQYLQLHMKKHDRERFKCDHCTLDFLLEDDLQKHREANGLTEQLHSCDKCPEQFPSLRKLQVHTYQHYPKTKNINCPVCAKIISKYNLKTHMRTHTGERPYVCNVCQKAFTQQGALKIHMEYHTGQRNYKCNFCDKTYITKGAVDIHEMIHMNLKTYVCTYCQKGFNDPSAAKRHERTHTKDKRYKCQKCPMAFTDASGLIAHRRRHTGVREHKCKECSFSFYTKTDLRKHEFLHTKKTTVECDICKIQFALKQYLKTHLKTVHGPQKKVKCRVCKAQLKPLSLANHMKELHGIESSRRRMIYESIL